MRNTFKNIALLTAIASSFFAPAATGDPVNGATPCADINRRIYSAQGEDDRHSALPVWSAANKIILDLRPSLNLPLSATANIAQATAYRDTLGLCLLHPSWQLKNAVEHALDILNAKISAITADAEQAKENIEKEGEAGDALCAAKRQTDIACWKLLEDVAVRVCHLPNEVLEREVADYCHARAWRKE